MVDLEDSGDNAMANLVEQIFQQAQSGTAQGQHLGDYYFEGKKLRQDQQRINLLERQFAQQAAMQEVSMITERQQQAINAQKLSAYLRGQQAMVNLSETMGAMGDASPIERLKMHAEAGRRNPDLFLAPEYNQMGEQYTKIAQQDSIQTWRVAQAELAEARAAAATLKAENDKLRLEQSERRIGLGEKIEDRKERELALRIEQYASKMDPRQRELMHSQLAAIQADSWMDLDTKIKRQEEVATKFGMPTIMPPAPSNLQTPAPAAGGTNAPPLQPATKRFKWTPGGLQPK